MIPQTLTAIKALLNADQSLSDKERSLIERVCENPAAVSLSKDVGCKITPAQAASILSCHRKTLFRYVKKGILHPVYHNARRVRFDKLEVEHFAAHGASTPEKSTQ